MKRQKTQTAKALVSPVDQLRVKAGYGAKRMMRSEEFFVLTILIKGNWGAPVFIYIHEPCFPSLQNTGTKQSVQLSPDRGESSPCPVGRLQHRP